jgi:hypothetical protein
MKTLMVLCLISLYVNTAHSQNPFLNDSLVKKIYVSSNGDTIHKYVDFEGSIRDLPSPKTTDDEIATIADFPYKSDDEIMKIAMEIFSLEELNTLIESGTALSCISLSSGEIVSASFMFFKSEPEICLTKFVKFSQQMKERITIESTFEEEIGEEGYLESSYRLYMLLPRELEK